MSSTVPGPFINADSKAAPTLRVSNKDENKEYKKY